MAKKKDKNEYVANSNCVLIKKGANYLVVTEDKEAVKYLKFEKE